jgi:glycosyltransferase involved in cell wall biosynthesis
MLIPEKGIQHAIKALSLLCKDYGKRILYIVAGEGHYRKTLESMADHLGIADQVLFLGKRSDIQAVIAASDIVVVPSVWEEAFGLIIAEAMACARPIIASNIGGIPELIETGISGITVKPGDAEELAKALDRLIENPGLRQFMGQAGLQKATREFELGNYVKQLADIYDSIV